MTTSMHLEIVPQSIDAESWRMYKADKDNSGTLTVKELREVLDDICERYPQVGLYLKNKQMNSLVSMLKDSKGDIVKESVEVNLEEFTLALSKVDSQMKNLPATAQVAAQQGSYQERGEFHKPRN